jgi:hypothetical protein
MSATAQSGWCDGLRIWLGPEGTSEALLKKNLMLTPAERLDEFVGYCQGARATTSGTFGAFQARRLLDTIPPDLDAVVVGGVAAVLHGSFLMTWDLDLVAPDTASVRSRWTAVFGQPSHGADEAPGALFFITTFGNVDCRLDSTMHGKLVLRAQNVSVSEHAVKVACVDDLVELKSPPANQDQQLRLWELLELRELLKAEQI